MIARKIDDRRIEGAVLGNLGNAAANLGESQRAIEFYHHAIAIAREIGDRRGEGNVLFNSALLLNQLGERGEAMSRMENALQIYEQIEDPTRERARAILEEWLGSGEGRP